MDLRLKILLGAIVVLVFGGITAAVVAGVKSESAGDGKPQLKLETSGFDFGEVAMSDGLAKRVVEIKNTGDADLKITQMQTSCMCTTVTLEVGGEKSPPFGMPGHGGGASAFWSATIKPGESGSLEIVFDPNAHGPDAVGPVSRDITIVSNNGGRAGAKSRITFEAEVVKGGVKKIENVEPALSASQNGVEVVVQDIKRENNKTIVEFTADNHVFDLSTMDVKSQSKLAGLAPSDYSILESGGGHHLRAALTFDGNLAGSLVIGFNPDLIFNLAIE